ncbi:MAG: galactokinase, partial [Bdellovibrionota bacterium]
PYELVRIASHLEARVLMKPTGTQDYFPPIFGGMNVISYGVKGPEVEVRAIEQELFRDRFLLVYTGKSHHSGINNWQVIKQWLDGHAPTRTALTKLSVVSRDMELALKEKRVDDLPKIFEREFEARCELSEGFSSPEIRKLSEIARANGAIAKICGAGGGGCVLIWCPDRQIEKVKKALTNEKFQVLATQPWSEATGQRAGGH